MPGVDLTQISSNWKKLQSQLTSEKKDVKHPHGNTLKRKRDGIQNLKEESRKQAKSSVGRAAKRMGGLLSNGVSIEEKGATRRLELQNRYDIPVADIDGVYGQSEQLSQEDDINGGRHTSHKAGKYLALDCEMVGTGPPPHSDDLLARVSIVNFHSQQIYDSYVQPVFGMEVKDYRTHVSGIRPEHLRPGIARPFSQVQKDVFDLLRGNILVGHALRKDLQALQLDHPKRDIRDTSRHGPYRIESKGKPPALRHLAKTHLGIVIQKGEHSSLEDARATMMLYKREKTGFEAENRKRYGAAPPRRPVALVGSTPRSIQPADDEGYDTEDDERLLQEEEYDGDAPAEDVEADATASKVAKKRKTKRKKRTKR